jgi:hypothetical protein
MPQNIFKRPNGHKIYKHRTLQNTPKFTKIALFGLKINRLATLFTARTRMSSQATRQAWASFAKPGSS